MDIEFVDNLGHTVETKTITIERLSKGGYVILGTPKLSMEELNQVIGVCFHQREQNVKNKKR